MTSDERNILRNLANEWIEISEDPVMEKRKLQWTALKDLKAVKPMVLVETSYIENYVHSDELMCIDPFLRNIEAHMRQKIRHFREVGDDIVLESVYMLNWDYKFSDNGFSDDRKTAVDNRGMSHAYVYENHAENPEDIRAYKNRIGTVNRQKTFNKKKLLDDTFGDILPVAINGASTINAIITKDLFKILGMERMMLWQYDEPEALNTLLKYIHDDRKEMLKWLEDEELLGLNNNSNNAGSGSPGFTSDLPAADFNGKVRRKDKWIWTESQETSSVSPSDFEKIYLPHLADISKDFGLVYYGCCEPVHDRWDMIIKQIPHIRAVSISPWCDKFIMGEKLGRDYVFSVKPFPGSISGIAPDWAALKDDVKNALKAAEKCNLEFIFRDLIDIGGDRKRLNEWVKMTRNMIGE